MSRKISDKARRRRAAEEGSASRPWGGRLSVALVFPNTYRQGMSNLGFLSVYDLINRREDALCERFFLPDPDDLAEHRKAGFPLVSLESGRPLSDFDLVAFSISFENDYLNLPQIFELGRLPLFAAERGERHPLVLCGGVCAFLNPEPLAEIMDLFAVGEAEAILPALLTTLQQGGGRDALLEKLVVLPGVYVPAFHAVEHRADGTIASCRPVPPAPSRVARQWVRDLDKTEARSVLFTDEAELGDMALIEVSRGCSRGCRFCAAGFLYLPPREKSLDRLLQQAEEGLCRRTKIGLVGTAVSDYPRLDELNRGILDRGGAVSVASLRIDSLSEAEVEALAVSGHRTVALAPEAGSQRLRDVINKGLDEGQILRAVQLLAAAGIPNLKLYFLIGLPTETEADVDELLALVEKIRSVWLAEGKKLGRLGNVSLSVNPFIPKPFTPFQWSAMAGEKVLKKRMQRIRGAVARMANTEVAFESVREAILQAFLSRGDRRLGQILPLLAAGDSLSAACRSLGLDLDFYLWRERLEDEIFPWEVLESGVRRDYLWQEYQRGQAGRSTPRCFAGCRRCGVCG